MLPGHQHTQCDLSGVELLDEDTPDDGAAAVPFYPDVSPFAPYHRPADEAELTAASQRRWTQRRAMFDAMPDGMPADEQVRRVSLALDYSAATVDALTTWNAYSEQTVVAMLSEMAVAVGHEELGDQLASSILLRAANGAHSVGPADAQKSSALIPMMMRVAQRVGVARVEKALRALVAPAAPAAAAPVAPNAPAALTAVGDAASPSTAAPNAPAVPVAYAETASSSIAAPAASDSNEWMCPACDTKNANSDEVCTTYARGRQCNSTRATGVVVGGKRPRTATQRLDVQNGAGQSYESGSGGAPPPGPRSRGAGGGMQGSNAPARGKGRAAAATPALPPAVPTPAVEHARSAVTDAEDAKITALKELDQLVGIADAKKTVTELCDTVIHGLLERQAGGGEPLSTNKHMLFLGNPGTGKTTVAKIMARLLKGMGVVATERYCYYENARTALVDGHVGGTAGKATRVINRAVGGVLFLDEARLPPIARRTLTCT
mgnify:FL=1